MSRSRLFLLILLGCLVTFFSCSSGEGEFLDTATAVVLISGQYNGQACYWRVENGAVTRISLPSSGTPSLAWDIAFSDGKVYTAGYYMTSLPCYWEDTAFKSVYPGAGGSATITSLFVEGGIVFTAGNSFSGGINHYCYWINTDKLISLLPIDNSNSTKAYQIRKKNDTLFISGYFYNGSNNHSCYWRNGIRIDLTGGSGYDNTVKLAFTGNSLIVAGVNPGAQFKIWRDDIIVSEPGNNELPINASFTTEYNYGLHATRSAIFICGRYGTNAAYYCYGQKLVVFPEANSQATGITTAGKSIFICGLIQSGANYIPTLWTETGRIDLESAAMPSTKTTAVIVVPRSKL